MTEARAAPWNGGARTRRTELTRADPAHREPRRVGAQLRDDADAQSRTAPVSRRDRVTSSPAGRQEGVGRPHHAQIGVRVEPFAVDPPFQGAARASVIGDPWCVTLGIG
jgi:hypothetical protein